MTCSSTSPSQISFANRAAANDPDEVTSLRPAAWNASLRVIAGSVLSRAVAHMVELRGTIDVEGYGRTQKSLIDSFDRGQRGHRPLQSLEERLVRAPIRRKP